MDFEFIKELLNSDIVDLPKHNSKSKDKKLKISNKNSYDFSENDVFSVLNNVQLDITELKLKRKNTDDLDNKIIREINIKGDKLRLLWNKILKDSIEQIVESIIVHFVSSEKHYENIYHPMIIQCYKNIIDKKENRFSFFKEKIFDSKIPNDNYVKTKVFLQLYDPHVILENNIKNSSLLLRVKGNTQIKFKKSKNVSKQANNDFKMNMNFENISTFYNPYFSLLQKVYFNESDKDNKVEFQEIFYTKQVTIQMLQSFKQKSKEFKDLKDFKAFNINLSKNSNQNVNDQNTEGGIHNDDKKDYIINMKMDLDVKQTILRLNSNQYNVLNNILEFMFDRGFSLDEEIKAVNEKLNAISNETQFNEISKKIYFHNSALVKSTPIKEVNFKFDLINIFLQEKGSNKTIIEAELKGLDGVDCLFSNKSSQSKINVRDLKIYDTNRNKTIMKREIEIENIEDKLPLVYFRKKDSFLSVFNCPWYIIDSVELISLPLKINVNKEEIQFMISFFEDDKNIDIKGGSAVKQSNLKDSFTNQNNANNTSVNDSTQFNLRSTEEIVKFNKDLEKIPIYFKKVKVNGTEIKLNFFYEDKSHLNLHNMIFNFRTFLISNSFLTKKEITKDFYFFITNQLISNLPSLVGNFLFGDKEANVLQLKNDNEETQNLVDSGTNKNSENEEKLRAMLFGKKWYFIILFSLKLRFFSMFNEKN